MSAGGQYNTLSSPLPTTKCCNTCNREHTQQTGVCAAVGCKETFHRSCFAANTPQLFLHTSKNMWYGSEDTMYCAVHAPFCDAFLEYHSPSTDFSSRDATVDEPWSPLQGTQLTQPLFAGLHWHDIKKTSHYLLTTNDVMPHPTGRDFDASPTPAQLQIQEAVRKQKAAQLAKRMQAQQRQLRLIPTNCRGRSCKQEKKRGRGAGGATIALACCRRDGGERCN